MTGKYNEEKKTRVGNSFLGYRAAQTRGIRQRDHDGLGIIRIQIKSQIIY